MKHKVCGNFKEQKHEFHMNCQNDALDSTSLFTFHLLSDMIFMEDSHWKWNVDLSNGDYEWIQNCWYCGEKAITLCLIQYESCYEFLKAGETVKC